MHFGNSAGNFGGSAVRRPVGHGSAAAMSKLVALLPNYMQIVQNWSEKGVLSAKKMGSNENLTPMEGCHDTSIFKVIRGVRGVKRHPTPYW